MNEITTDPDDMQRAKNSLGDMVLKALVQIDLGQHPENFGTTDDFLTMYLFANGYVGSDGEKDALTPKGREIYDSAVNGVLDKIL